MTLTRRISLLIAAVLLLALGGSVALHSLAVRQVLQSEVELRNRDAAAVLALALSQQHGDATAMARVAAAQFDLGHYQSIRLQAPGAPPSIALQQPPRAPTAPAWFVRVLPLTAPPGRAPVSDGPRELGELQLTAETTWAHDALWAACARTAALLAALAAAAATAAAWALRAWQRPLQATVAQAQALEQGRFVEAVEPGLPELRDLTRSMNSTVRRLREVFAAQAEQVALLQRQAQQDALTGLPLRASFLVQLQRRLAEPGGPGSALLLVRLLNLEALNPRIGHEATDRVLRAIADVLLTYVERAPGTFAGRLNGGDFALCLPVPGLAQETAESLAGTLASAAALRAGGGEVVVGGADGLRDTTAGAALAAADAALARAEAGAGVAIEQHGELVADVAGARAWREQIAAALAEGRTRIGEFNVVDPAGETIHLECPLRVQLNPGGAYQDAARWLALAQRSRLMPQVDLAALELALHAIATDGRARAVHASPVSLAAPGFIAEVTRRLAAAPAAARKLSIECVEGPQPAVLQPLAAAAAAWRPFGLRLGVEHAGAAPQQLPVLHGTGIDYVKVDARHLRGVAGSAAVRDYAQSLVALIHGMGLQVLAEGIADAADLAVLWELGYDGGTGPAVAPA